MIMTRFRRPSAFVTIMVPSSSGLGRLVLIQKIAGSTPAGITKNKKDSLKGYIFYSLWFSERGEPAGLAQTD